MNSKLPHARRLSATAALSAAVLCAAGAVSAATTTVNGQGTYFVSRDLLPLANGGAAVHIKATTVVSAQPSDSGLMFGECAGLAHLAEGESYRSRLYCNFTENGSDGFTIQADNGLEGGEVTVIGGSGRFEGATGSGSLKALGEEDGGRGRYSYEFKITTP